MEVKGKTKDTLLQEQGKNSTLIQTNPFPPIFNKIPATSIQVLCNVPLHGRLVTMYGKGIIGDLLGSTDTETGTDMVTIMTHYHEQFLKNYNTARQPK